MTDPATTSPTARTGEPRLARLRPESLGAEQRLLYDDIVGGPRAQGPQLFALVGDDGALEGPFNALLVAPAVGTALQSLGAAVRYATSLSPRVREAAILMVAAAWGSEFEIYAHERIGANVGLTETELEALRSRRPFSADDPAEIAAHRLVAALLEGGDLSDEQYDTARAALGEQAIFELTTLVGYYTTLALQLRVFRVAAPNSNPPVAPTQA